MSTEPRPTTFGAILRAAGTLKTGEPLQGEFECEYCGQMFLTPVERGRHEQSSCLTRRVDALADERERRRVSPLGVGYYTPDVRRKAKAVAASMLAGAAAHGITLGVLDMTCDLAATALDVASHAVARERYLRLP